MDDAQKAALAFVKRRMAETGMDPSTLARAAGLAPSTLTRLVNNPEVKHSLSGRTLEKLKRVPSVTGVPPPDVIADRIRALPPTKMRAMLNLLDVLTAEDDDSERARSPPPFPEGGSVAQKPLREPSMSPPAPQHDVDDGVKEFSLARRRSRAR